jgi:hypothetical protein
MRIKSTTGAHALGASPPGIPACTTSLKIVIVIADPKVVIL